MQYDSIYAGTIKIEEKKVFWQTIKQKILINNNSSIQSVLKGSIEGSTQT
jgi:hypothetical protein